MPEEQAAQCILRTGDPAYAEAVSAALLNARVNATGINATGINVTGINATGINATGDPLDTAVGCGIFPGGIPTLSSRRPGGGGR